MTLWGRFAKVSTSKNFSGARQSNEQRHIIQLGMHRQFSFKCR